MSKMVDRGENREEQLDLRLVIKRMEQHEQMVDQRITALETSSRLILDKLDLLLSKNQ